MINCIFLSRDLPFTWLFDEVKDVLPWPGKRKTRAVLMKSHLLFNHDESCIRINNAKLS